jgi:hypothetical protein
MSRSEAAAYESEMKGGLVPAAYNMKPDEMIRHRRFDAFNRANELLARQIADCFSNGCAKRWKMKITAEGSVATALKWVRAGVEKKAAFDQIERALSEMKAQRQDAPARLAAIPMPAAPAVPAAAPVMASSATPAKAARAAAN